MNFRIAVKAFIVDNQKLLVLKRRSSDVHKPGSWDIPGGRLELGEDPFVGLAREVKEETGMQISIDAPLDIHHFTRDDGQSITMLIFLCSVAHGTEVTLSEEHTEYQWVAVTDRAAIPDWLTPVVEKYQKHFQEEA